MANQPISGLNTIATGSVSLTGAYFPIEQTSLNYRVSIGQMQTIALTNGAVTGYLTFPNSGLKVSDTSSNFFMTIEPGSSFSANRTFTLVTGDSNRMITFGGDLSFGGEFTASGAYPVVQTYTASTNVTFPTTGTLATLAGSETFSNKTLTSPTINTPTISGGTLDNSVIGGVTAAAATVTALIATSGVIGSPTGGNQGTGTINATGLFINGVPVESDGQVVVTNQGSSGSNFYPTFVGGTSGTQAVYINDTYFYYTPSTSTLYSSAFYGNLTGNVTGDLTGNASSASSISIIDSNSLAAYVYPVWVDSNSGYLGVYTSSTKITFYPVSGLLTCSSVAANISVPSTITMQTGSTIQTGTSATNNFIIAAYNTTSSPVQAQFFSIASNNTPSAAWSQPSGGQLTWDGGAIGSHTPATGAFTTLTNTAGIVRHVRIVTASGAVTVTSADDIVVINKGTPAATVVNLPAPGTLQGQQYIIKDGNGSALVYNYTLTPASGNIDGSSTYVINNNYGSVTIVDNGTQYNVI